MGIHEAEDRAHRGRRRREHADLREYLARIEDGREAGGAGDRNPGLARACYIAWRRKAGRGPSPGLPTAS
jgi:hypothetical protein